MSSETFTYKGISAGKYIEGEIEAINQEEASFKLKSQRIIITSLIQVKEQKKPEAKKKSSGGFSLFGGKAKPKDVMIFVKNGRLFSLSELIFFILPHATFDKTGAPCNKFSCSGISSI